MRFYKLDVAKDATANAIAFNSTVKPELIPEENDPYRIQWVTTAPTGEYVVGERVSLKKLFRPKHKLSEF